MSCAVVEIGCDGAVLVLQKTMPTMISLSEAPLLSSPSLTLANDDSAEVCADSNRSVAADRIGMMAAVAAAS